jgi:hypothetical protein
MAVSSRIPALATLETGVVLSVSTENLTQAWEYFTLCEPEKTKNLRDWIRVDRGGSKGPLSSVRSVGWGVGTRVLRLTWVIPDQPGGVWTPVVVLRDSAVRGGAPVAATLLESVLEPVLSYYPPEKKITLHYWVNAWSPPSSPGQLPTLFQKVRPAAPNQVDSYYLTNQDSISYRPPQDFTALRDVPNWYRPGTSPDPDAIPGSITEHVGPFNINQFWVAPWTDAHLFRFPSDTDPFPIPLSQPPVIPGDPSTSPPPPPSVLIPPTQDFLENFPYLTVPQTETVLEINSILNKLKNQQTLTGLEQASLNQYRYALSRLAGLARCTRVLMRAEGMLALCRRKVDRRDTGEDPQLYLVLRPPIPVMALPRGINKVMLGRPKMTSFLGTDTFVTAALNYRYPAAATVSLCAGDPQVDFGIFNSSDRFDENRRMGLLPEAASSQGAAGVPQSSISIPVRYGASLVEVLSNMSIW